VNRNRTLPLPSYNVYSPNEAPSVRVPVNRIAAMFRRVSVAPSYALEWPAPVVVNATVSALQTNKLYFEERVPIRERCPRGSLADSAIELD